jgi:hypothetical protein
VSAGTPSTVTFDVEWDKADLDLKTLWSDTMWVFVDYNKNGRMARMELLLGAGATLTATSSPGVGKLVEENVKGAWVVGDARTNAAGSFSARVQLLTATADLYGACAYASSYPPLGQYVSESEIVFSGTPMYEIKLLYSDGNTVETIESGGTFLLPCDYTVSSFTDATGAPGIINCMPPTDYTLSALPGTEVCEGAAVTLTLSGSESGRRYQLYNGDVPVAGSEADGTGSALNFSGTSAVGGYTYTVRTVDGSDVQCNAPASNALGVTVNPAFSPGTITNASTTTDKGVNPNVTIDNITAADGGNGVITYQWRRSGDSNATLTGNAATYTIGTDATNYSTAGTYYFNRYAHDGACSTTFVAATGTYTLYVIGPPGASPTTLCTQCCWDGDAVDPSAGTWVNCYVTGILDDAAQWSGDNDTFYPGASGPGSDKNGRRNTAAISSSTTTVNAVQVCKDLGTGWYLPAYEELVNMSYGLNSSTLPLNNLSGAKLLMTNRYHWSSTESSGNEGRYESNPGNQIGFAVKVYYYGTMTRYFKSNKDGFLCVWRPEIE